MANELVVRTGFRTLEDTNEPVKSISTNYTGETTDRTIVASGATDISVKLSAATDNIGKIYTFKNLSDSANLTILTTGGDQIDKSSSFVIKPLQDITVQSTGDRWILAGNSGTSGTSGILPLSGTTTNGIITYNGDGSGTVENKFIFDGTNLFITGSTEMYSTTSGSTVFEIIGTQGQLFSVTDNLEGVLFSVSDVSGLPILTVNSNDSVVMGTFNSETLVVSGDSVGIGTGFPTNKLTVVSSDRKSVV